MFRSTFSLNAFLLRSGFCSGLAQRNVARDQNLAVEVEVDRARAPEELQLHLGVLGRRLEHVLLGAVVQDELHRKGAMVASTFLRPRELHVRHLTRSEEHTSELQSRQYLVCRLLLEKKKY